MRIPEGGGAGTRGGAASRMSTRAKKAETKKLIKADKTKPVAQQPPKKSVKVKPAAKTKAMPVDKAKILSKESSSRNRAGDKAYKKVEAETKKYKPEERTGYEHRYASEVAERAGNNAKLSPKIARKAAATNPVAKKALKAEKKLDKQYWKDMYNSRNG